MEFIYWTTENTTSDNRRCTVTATQSESGKKLIYTIVQQPNNATFFSSYKPAFFASVQQTCIAVHSTFRVEGVDF